MPCKSLDYSTLTPKHSVNERLNTGPQRFPIHYKALCRLHADDKSALGGARVGRKGPREVFCMRSTHLIAGGNRVLRSQVAGDSLA